MSIMEGQTLKSGWDDKWLWRDPQNCKYSVKSTYEKYFLVLPQVLLMICLEFCGVC